MLIEAVEVTLDGLDPLEQASTDKYAWLSAEDFGPDERPADPDIPDLIRAAAAAVRGRVRGSRGRPARRE